MREGYVCRATAVIGRIGDTAVESAADDIQWLRSLPCVEGVDKDPSGMEGHFVFRSAWKPLSSEILLAIEDRISKHGDLEVLQADIGPAEFEQFEEDVTAEIGNIKKCFLINVGSRRYVLPSIPEQRDYSGLTSTELDRFADLIVDNGEVIKDRSGSSTKEISVDKRYSRFVAESRIHEESIDNFIDSLVQLAQNPGRPWELSLLKDKLRKTLLLAYQGLGLAGEAGEVADKIKKVIRDKNFSVESSADEIAKELGDTIWYAFDMMPTLGTDFEEVVEKNMEKIRSRIERDAQGGGGDNR